jgi:superoxide dismutase, Cu-Zn family
MPRTAASLILIVFAGCSSGTKTKVQETAATAENVKKAAAGGALEPRSGSAVTGMVQASPAGSGVHLVITVANATPGKHGVHLHETGDCSSPDAKSAGGHFNPDKGTHGAPGAGHHGGDLGNMEVGADGKGKLEIDVPGLTLAAGEHSVVGRAVVVHAKEDDLTSQPAGNSGDRVACGVIVEAP